jgi:cysteine desulfuration protein SufE
VWLAVAVENGVLRLRWDADSPLVKGLAGLLCRVYEGSPAAEAAQYATGVLTALGLHRQLSPTRLNGLMNVARRIRELARPASNP